MVWVLDNRDIEAVLNMDTCLDTLEEAYRDLSVGEAINSPRSDLLTPCEVTSRLESSLPSYHMLKTMSGATRKYASIRFLTDLLHWPEVDGGIRRERTPESKGPISVTRGLILLFDIQSGDLLCVLSEGHIRNLRVGGTAGLAARYLARRDACRVGVLGSGFMAKAHIEALYLVRKLTSVKVYSPTLEHRTRFAREINEKFHLESFPVDNPELAIRDVDILVLASNAVHPIIDAAWLEKGIHITSVRHLEIGAEAFARCDLIALNSKTEARVLYYIAQARKGTRVPEGITLDYVKGHPPGDTLNIDWEGVPELTDFVAGRHPGRTGDDQISCFDNTPGLGIQFTSVAGRVYEMAKERGLGKEAPAYCFPDMARNIREQAT
jgi:ornithine cyclodeaminase/alanine dehydrogenase-like protein (mu-crystallin family)